MGVSSNRDRPTLGVGWRSVSGRPPSATRWCSRRKPRPRSAALAACHAARPGYPAARPWRGCSRAASGVRRDRRSPRSAARSSRRPARLLAAWMAGQAGGHTSATPVLRMSSRARRLAGAEPRHLVRSSGQPRAGVAADRPAGPIGRVRDYFSPRAAAAGRTPSSRGILSRAQTAAPTCVPAAAGISRPVFTHAAAAGGGPPGPTARRGAGRRDGPLPPSVRMGPRPSLGLRCRTGARGEPDRRGGRAPGSSGCRETATARQLGDLRTNGCRPRRAPPPGTARRPGRAAAPGHRWRYRSSSIQG